MNQFHTGTDGSGVVGLKVGVRAREVDDAGRRQYGCPVVMLVGTGLGSPLSMW